MAICRTCGRRASPTATICPACGASLDLPPLAASPARRDAAQHDVLPEFAAPHDQPPMERPPAPSQVAATRPGWVRKALLIGLIVVMFVYVFTSGLFVLRWVSSAKPARTPPRTGAPTNTPHSLTIPGVAPLPTATPSSSTAPTSGSGGAGAARHVPLPRHHRRLHRPPPR